MARGLHQGASHPDEGEFVNVEKIPLQTLLDQVMDGQIDDGKTIIAILKAAKLLGLK